MRRNELGAWRLEQGAGYGFVPILRFALCALLLTLSSLLPAPRSLLFAATPCIKHTFVSSKTDAADATLIRASDWNACHTVEDGAIDASKLSFDPATQAELDTHSGLNAAADGATKGHAGFLAADFDAASGIISLDYANGQKASGSLSGFLSSTDWTTFNAKESALTFSAPLNRSVNTISCPTASGSQAGCLSTTDWTTFNSKGAGTVTSVGLAGTANQITVTGSSPIIGSGSWTLSIPSSAQLSVAKLTNLTSNGFVKTSGGDGTLSVDTASYLVGPTLAASAVTGLTANTTPALTDIIYMVDDPSGSPLSQKITIANLLATASPGLTGPVTITEAVGSSGLTITGATQTSSFPALSITQTWNAAGTTFTGIKANITSTASAAASLLMDLQVGGVSKFSVSKASVITASQLTFSLSTDTLPTNISRYSDGTVAFFSGGALYARVVYGGFMVEDQLFFGRNAGAQTTILQGDAADVIAQRRTTNAQTFRVYGTYTDASNYERASLSHTTGTGVRLAAETAGTGGDNLNVALAPAGTGGVTLGANYQQFTEMTAPAAGAANTARLYAQDNGAGKTQLCALFPSGAAQCFATEP